MKSKAIFLVVVSFITGLFLGGLALHLWVYAPELGALRSEVADLESELADLDSVKRKLESDLWESKTHSAMKICYYPWSPMPCYNVNGVFNISFIEVSEIWIRGNLTNLTESTMNKIALIVLPRYNDKSLDIDGVWWDDVVEVLDPGQTKEFTIMSDVEENQLFDLLVMY